jgi:DNA-binding GntR family transcriptional regulator
MKKFNNLMEKVYRWVIQLMLESELVPGQRLVLVDIASQLKVSRTPVDNALAILAQEGYLDFVPNQGYAVHRLTKQEKQDLYEIRETIEVGFIGQVICKMTERAMKAVTREMLEVERQLAGNFSRQVFLHDMNFHEAFLLIAGNGNLSQSYRDICQKLYICFRPDGIDVSRVYDLREEHRNLYEAVKSKDLDRARAILYLHRNILENLDQQLLPNSGSRKWVPRSTSIMDPAISY